MDAILLFFMLRIFVTGRNYKCVSRGAFNSLYIDLNGGFMGIHIYQNLQRSSLINTILLYFTLTHAWFLSFFRKKVKI
jgi:hypothetical protein